MEQKTTALVVADISGYTRFVLKNRAHWAHAQLIISELLAQIVGTGEPTLRLEKLEGDAAFFVESAPHKADDSIATRIETMFEGFAATLRQMVDRNGCPCEACEGIGDLRLKVVVHRGEVIEQEIAGRQEVSGVAVIIAHRLLKNSITSNHYLLFTDEALDVSTRGTDALERGSIEDPDLGSIPYWLHYPSDPLGMNPPVKVSWLVRKMKAMWLMIRSMPLLLGSKGRSAFTASLEE
jgi:class 3 adenylate cyclase